MSLPEALPYESAVDHDDTLYWRYFRLLVVVWSVTVLCRHGLYWGAGLAGAPGLGRLSGWMIVSFLLAIVECVVLGLVLWHALRLRRGDRQRHASLANLCGIFVIVSVVGFTIDNFTFAFSAILHPIQWAPFCWRVVSRAQLLIVPAMVVFMLARPRTTRSQSENLG